MREGLDIWPMGWPGCFIEIGGIPGRIALGVLSEGAGEGPKPSVVVGDAAVARAFGDPVGRWPACIGGRE